MNPKKLSVLYFNSNSIPGKLSQIQAYVEIHKPQIIAVTETKINNDFDDNELLGPGYTIIRKDRNKWGGGVLLAVNNNAKEVHVLNNSTGPGEAVTINVCFLNKLRFNLVSYYRPPSEINLDSLYDLLGKDLMHPTIFLGDFNLPDIDWVSRPGEAIVKTNSVRKGLHQGAIDLLQCSNLVQLVTEPTHSKGNTLDLVLVENSLLDDITTKCEVLPPISDHNMILVTIELQNFTSKKSLVTQKKKLNFKKAEFHKINQKFEDLFDLYDKNRNYDTLELWGKLTQTIKDSTTEHIPILLSSPKGKPWMSRDLINQTYT